MNYANNQAANNLDQFVYSQGKTMPGLDQAPQPKSPMDGATAELQMSLEVLSTVADELRSRLIRVLRPGGTENGCKEQSAPRDVSSPLRDQLGSTVMRVGAIRNTLSDILDRLEV